MTHDVAVVPRILPMTQADIDNVSALERGSLQRDQIPIAIDHILHGKIYSRTMFIPAGVMVTGALIKVPTTLVIDGDVTVYVGGELRLRGHNVLPASAGRKQAFVAHTDTYVTMSFATEAKTVSEAEREFTDDHERLASHASPFNTYLVTGE